MTEKEFLNRLANGSQDVVQEFLDLLNEHGIDYCLVGGLAVNAYVEPVVSLDLNLVVATQALDKICKAAEKAFDLKKFRHSINLKSPKSDLRIQLQTDARYQAFVKSATTKKVMGYEMKVARLEDVLKGKVWAYSDQERRKSKRQKDLADISRIIESYPELAGDLPEEIRQTIL